MTNSITTYKKSEFLPVSHEAFSFGATWDDGQVCILKTQRFGPGTWDVNVFYYYTDEPEDTLTKDAWNFQVRHTPDGVDEEDDDDTYHWCERVLRDPDGTLFLAEVHYSNKPDGTVMLHGYTDLCLVGDSLQKLRDTLARLTSVLDKPIINTTDFDKE